MDWSIILALASSFFLGLSKAGLKGLGIVVVVLMAHSAGAKASTGLLLPLLIVGDILAVLYYSRFAKWKYLYQFMPAMIVGVLIAAYFGKNIDEKTFKFWMAIIVLVSVIILFWRDIKKDRRYPKNPIFATTMGIVSGFTTMIGNLAGAFSNMYFLATQLPKNEIIATSAWVFFLINIFKLPIHIFSWETITLESFKQDLILIPAVIIGFIIGLKIVSLFSELWYRRFLLFATGIGAIAIFF